MQGKVAGQGNIRAQVAAEAVFHPTYHCGEFQVLRMFLLIVGMEKGYKAQTSIIEIGQYWWNMQGRKTVVAIQRVLGHYVDTFPIIVLWRYATIMKPISILPTHPYI